MAARRGPHVIKLHDPNPPLLGRAPGAAAAAPLRDEGPSHAVLAHHPRAAATASAHPAFAAIEERLVARDQDIQELLVDNQRFAATHVALQQQLIAAQHELRAVHVASTRARAEREGEVRALADQAVHIEAEARVVAAAREEVDRVHADIQVLAAARAELVDRLQGLREQLARMQAEAGKTEAVRAQIETMRREIQKGRAAVDFEKKAHADNLEQSKTMEKNMIAVASEIEKLRGDLVNAEKWATAITPAAAVANPGYAATYGNSEATYTATYGNPEATYAAQSYPDAYRTNQAQMHTDGNSHYMTQPVPYAQYESQHTNAQR
ncbi:protein FLX-like 1 [Phragmites australis]|uniref:protein FLX-like 1 n=1 Tax=Phragmites australis TaxID=29695 RepID=UPI002D7683C9|nr:protein FLX-like 1 [Phragmites australis]